MIERSIMHFKIKFPNEIKRCREYRGPLEPRGAFSLVYFLIKADVLMNMRVQNIAKRKTCKLFPFGFLPTLVLILI